MENEEFSDGWKPDHDEIIAALAAYLESYEQRDVIDQYMMPRGFQFTNGNLPPGADRIWIKFSHDFEYMQWQANTQAWAHECITKDENVNARFHVPRVYDVIETRFKDLPYGLFVMEFAKGMAVNNVQKKIKTSSDMSEEDKKNKIGLYKDRVVEAVCLLYSLTPPEDMAPGPYRGGRVVNQVFSRDEPESPREYESVEDLQDWINSENERTNPGYPPIDLVSEEFRLCYCDMNIWNFIIEDDEDPSSRLTIIDFEHANFLPMSFLVYSSWLTHDAHLSEGIRLGAHLEVNEDTIYALHNIRMHRRLW